MTVIYVIVVSAALVLLGLAASVGILKQYERGVVFRLGRVKDGARGQGLIIIVPLVGRVYRVSTGSAGVGSVAGNAPQSILAPR